MEEDERGEAISHSAELTVAAPSIAQPVPLIVFRKNSRRVEFLAIPFETLWRSIDADDAEICR
jgi:hypothetical protein